MSDSESRDTCVRMTVHGNMLVGKYVVADSAADGFFEILTPEHDDDNANDDFIALRKDGVPARGAMVREIWNGDSTAFIRGLELYPNNYAIYFAKWKYLQGSRKLDKTKLQQEIAHDLQKLITITAPSPELYAALAVAYGALDKKMNKLRC